MNPGGSPLAGWLGRELAAARANWLVPEVLDEVRRAFDARGGPRRCPITPVTAAARVEVRARLLAQAADSLAVLADLDARTRAVHADPDG